MTVILFNTPKSLYLLKILRLKISDSNGCAQLTETSARRLHSLVADILTPFFGLVHIVFHQAHGLFAFIQTGIRPSFSFGDRRHRLHVLGSSLKLVFEKGCFRQAIHDL